MHLHTTTGVTAAGIVQPGSSSGAASAMATASSSGDAMGQLPPMSGRRSGLVPIVNAGTADALRPAGSGGGNRLSATGLGATSPLGAVLGGGGSGGGSSAAANNPGGSAGPSTLGRMMGAPSHGIAAVATSPRTATASGAAATALSTAAAAGVGAARGSPTANTTLAGVVRSGGGSGAGAGSGGGIGGSIGGGNRPASRAPLKDSQAPPRKVAAVDNIAEALGRFFQESMELAPKPPPRLPSSSSSEDGEVGLLSSDDEGTQEELDVLEKLYLVMPNLESPGKGAVQQLGVRGLASGPASFVQGPYRFSGSFTAVAGSNSRPCSPMPTPTPVRVPTLVAAGASATATGAGSPPARTGTAIRSISPSPTFAPGQMDGAAAGAVGATAGTTTTSPSRRKSFSGAVGKPGKVAGLGAALTAQQPTFLPSKAVLMFHQRALGISVSLRGSTPPGTAAGANPSGGGQGASAATLAGPYGSLSQAPQALLTNAYVNRDADYLMVKQMVETALVVGQSKPMAAAMGGGGVVGGAGAVGATVGRGLPAAAPPAASPSRRGRGRSPAAVSSKKKKAVKKSKLPPAPPQLLPRPAVPIHLQHLVRPGSASVGALMGQHQPAGIDPAIIAAVISGQSVDPVLGFGTPGSTPALPSGCGSSVGTPQRPLSPVRATSPLRPPSGSQGTPPPVRPAAAAAAARPPSPLKPGKGAASAATATAAADGSRTNSGEAAGDGKARSRAVSPSNRGGSGGGVSLPVARPTSGATGAPFGRHLSAGHPRPSTAPGNWTAARLERLRGVAATKAAARASMSPLQASLAAPISGMRARRVYKPLSDAEFGVLNRTMDAALMPLTRAAAKLGTYGEALPPPNLFTALTPTTLPKAPVTPASIGGASSSGGAGAVGVTAGAATAPDAEASSRVPSAQRPAAVVAAAAISGLTPAAAAAAPPPIDSAPPTASGAAAGPGPASGGGGSGGGGDEWGPRRKLRRPNVGGWDWPPGKGTAQPLDVLEETRHAVAAVLAGAEIDETGRSGPCDRVGEVGRLMRRFHKQESRTSFNLSHAVNGVDQIVALVDVLGHPDLASVSELLLAGNALNDEAFAPLGARLASVECGSLRQLDLGYNNLTAASVELLLPLMKDEVAAMSKAQRIRRGLDAGPLHGVLHRLVLDSNPIGDAGAELLCDAAASDYTQLAELRMKRCGLGERGAAAAGRLLENSSAIRILDVSWNNLGKRGGQYIGEGLRSASSIQQLYVAWTGITDVGASYIAKALKSNPTLQVLDLSGDSVSGDTSLVLLDSLSENGTLHSLVLRDNPVGVLAARKLLKALHGGVLEHVDLLGCSFGGMGGSTVVWDPHDPDGVYDLDLEVPAHYQVAAELMGLAASMGLRSWRSATLNGKPFRLNSTNKLQLPLRGRLHVEFVSCTQLVRNDGPLTDSEVRSMWFTIADPDGARTPQGPMSLPHEAPPAPPPAASNPTSPRRSKSTVGIAASPAVSGGGASSPVKKGAAGGRGTGGGARSGGGAEISSATELKGATDEWKLQLLEAMVTDVYLTCAQLVHILRCFDGRDARMEAVVQAFGVLVDTENFYAVLEELDSGSRQQVESRLGKVRMFFPENPTGRYTLMLSQLPHQCVAKQLLQQYIQQYDNKLTQHPNRVCFTTCNMDGVPTDVSDPHKLYLPQEGILELCFVDLRHPPHGARPLSRAQFAVLVSHLVNMEMLDPVGLTRIIDHPALSHAVGALRRWEAWTRNHVLASNVQYLFNATHEIRRKNDPAYAAAWDEAVAAAAGASGGAAGGGTVGGAGSGGGALRDSQAAMGSGDAPLPGATSSGSNSARGPGPSRLARESFADTVSVLTTPSTPPSVRVSTWGGDPMSPGPDTPNRRTTMGAGRESNAGNLGSPYDTLDVPSPARSTGGGGKGRPRTAPTYPTVPPVYVKDMERYVETIRILAVRHYLTCWQLMQLLQLLPPSATDERVETVTAFWARVTDRDAHWVDVMRSLSNEAQVRTCQRLGYMNVYTDHRPAMHYRLRMYKEDEHELAWQLYNKSLDSPMPCWKNLTIDDQPKRVNQGVNMWTVLRGNAADGTTPQTTLEFDFVWPDEDAFTTLAIRQIQRAWRLHKNPLSGGVAAPSPTRQNVNQQPRFAAFTKKKTTAPTSKMNDPKTRKK